MLSRPCSVAGGAVKPAEAQVAVGDEGAHAAVLGERQRVSVAGLAPLGIEPAGMGRGVADELQRVG